jgi:hypothetical protein
VVSRTLAPAAYHRRFVAVLHDGRRPPADPSRLTAFDGIVVRSSLTGRIRTLLPAKTRVFVDFVVEAFRRQQLAERSASSIG